MRSLGSLLRRERKKARLTQEQLAIKSDVLVSLIRSYEQGSREPMWANFFKLVRTLDMWDKIV